jgi:hypothetical protein
LPIQRDYANAIQKGRSIKIAGDTRPGTVGDLFEVYVKALKGADKMSPSLQAARVGDFAGVDRRRLRHVTGRRIGRALWRAASRRVTGIQRH